MSERSSVVRYLKTNGPSTPAELPRSGSSLSIQQNERELGVYRFDPDIANASGGSITRVGQTTSVWYLRDEHGPGDVIREWADANPRVIEDASPRAFIMAINEHGRGFSDVSKEVARDLYGDARWSDAFGNTGGAGGPVPGETLADKLSEMSPDEVFGNGDDN